MQDAMTTLTPAVLLLRTAGVHTQQASALALANQLWHRLHSPQDALTEGGTLMMLMYAPISPLQHPRDLKCLTNWKTVVKPIPRSGHKGTISGHVKSLTFVRHLHPPKNQQKIQQQVLVQTLPHHQPKCLRRHHHRVQPIHHPRILLHRQQRILARVQPRILLHRHLIIQPYSLLCIRLYIPHCTRHYTLRQIQQMIQQLNPQMTQPLALQEFLQRNQLCRQFLL